MPSTVPSAPLQTLRTTFLLSVTALGHGSRKPIFEDYLFETLICHVDFGPFGQFETIQVKKMVPHVSVLANSLSEKIVFTLPPGALAYTD
jgi:hypothetical protein